MLLLTTEKRHFARFRNHQDPLGFCNVGVASEILRSDNRGSDNRGHTVPTNLFSALPLDLVILKLKPQATMQNLQ